MAYPWVSACRFSSWGSVTTLMPLSLSPGVSRQRLLEDHDLLAGDEPELPVDPEHPGVVGAIVGVHPLDPLVGGVARDHHFQGPRDPTSPEVAQHAGVADFGITVRPPHQI